ncbi:hypothetical protein Poli38472_002069 [Pythium oligandrum]|uniref:Uncharacterized protein n=1 Tax=Pythium oligandrum TaxID=41045 RepID=A0A8K1CIL0_PYTOL|nr:hypothetical protein Poli38472_002069 [Pythium oligandrum]|eukprot:TMW63128.1 hypothetical protein Poli38472_002069 [Pythium oligandrum]
MAILRMPSRDDVALGLSLARRRSLGAMTTSISTPLRSVTARSLANIAPASSNTTSVGTSDTSSSLETVVEPCVQAPMPAKDPATLSATMRSFAVIVCNDCLYLEFPGCDVHGVLYTERAPEEKKEADATAPPEPSAGHREAGPPLPKLHAKCPKCSAATNNVRPFREGCRRCKAPTTIYMWCATLGEIAQAHEAFPSACDEAEHTALLCEVCQSVIFPRARGALTKRTKDQAMSSSNGKALQVYNFQRSMPHVEGCPRKGMPLQAVGIQLTKSELKFVLDRFDQCPFADRILGGPQYRKRQLEVVSQQNHLHQLYLRLLSSVIRSFDAMAPDAIEPLTKISVLFDRIEPLALFRDWAPPQALSITKCVPNRVEASSVLDNDHAAEMSLSEHEEDIWRPACTQTDELSSEWITFHFNSPSSVSAIELRWHRDLIPKRYSVSLILENNSVDTIAVVVSGRAHQNIAFAKRSTVVAVRISIFPDADSSTVSPCGLITALFHEAGPESLHTPSETLLQDLHQWLVKASLSTHEDVRDTALRVLQRLVMSSGSLCGMIQLAIGLLVNVSTDQHSNTAKTFDEQDWNRFDHLSESARCDARVFLVSLARNSLQLMVDQDTSSPGENSILDKGLVEQMRAILQGKASTSDTPLSLRALFSPVSKDGKSNERAVYPSITMASTHTTFLDCIKRRSQLGLIVLLMLSELSAWQMKRMQKAEEYGGKKEEELMQLEEPFSIQVRPQFFDLAHRLLSYVLASWTHSDTTRLKNLEEEEKASSSSAKGLGFDLYQLLQHSFTVLGSDLNQTGFAGVVDVAKDLHFTPNAMCEGVLQVITSNIRRMVLTHVDPADLGIEPAITSENDDDSMLFAPPALEPMVATLEQLTSLGAKRSDPFFRISLKAAAAMEVGMEAFYPSAHQRTRLLTSRMGKGATLEVQVRWPVQERDQEDPRYERLVLMLQFECLRAGFTHAIRGRWHFFMHLVVQIPVDQDTEEVLHKHFASCIKNAGFSSWQVVAGAQEISINLQRHLHWNRVEKMSHDAGSGWIRVYPRDVAQYEEVLSDIDHFLIAHDNSTRHSPQP